MEEGQTTQLSKEKNGQMDKQRYRKHTR